jgi:hypothetical protein
LLGPGVPGPPPVAAAARPPSPPPPPSDETSLPPLPPLPPRPVGVPTTTLVPPPPPVDPTLIAPAPSGEPPRAVMAPSPAPAGVPGGEEIVVPVAARFGFDTLGSFHALSLSGIDAELFGTAGVLEPDVEAAGVVASEDVGVPAAPPPAPPDAPMMAPDEAVEADDDVVELDEDPRDVDAVSGPDLEPAREAPPAQPIDLAPDTSALRGSPPPQPAPSVSPMPSGTLVDPFESCRLPRGVVLRYETAAGEEIARLVVGAPVPAASPPAEVAALPPVEAAAPPQGVPDPALDAQAHDETLGDSTAAVGALAPVGAPALPEDEGALDGIEHWSDEATLARPEGADDVAQGQEDEVEYDWRGQGPAALPEVGARLDWMNYYNLLQVGRSASSWEIKRAFQALVRELKLGERSMPYDEEGCALAVTILHRAALALSVLTEMTRRAEYDRHLKLSGERVYRSTTPAILAEAEALKGDVYLGRRNFGPAREAFLAAARHHPEVASYHCRLGIAIYQHCVEEGSDIEREATLALERAVVLDASLDEAHLYLGYIHKAQGALERAERELEAALACNPENNLAVSELRLLRLRRDRATRRL